MLRGVVIFLSSDFPYKDKSYGKIKGDDGKEYIFYSSDIMFIPDTLEADKTRVVFDGHKKKDGRLAARNVIANGIDFDDCFSINPNPNSVLERINRGLEAVERNYVLGEYLHREISVNCSFGEKQGYNIYVTNSYVSDSEQPWDFGHLVLQGIYAGNEDFWNNLSQGQLITFKGEVCFYTKRSGEQKYGIHNIYGVKKI